MSKARMFFIDDQGDVRYMASGALYRKATSDELVNPGCGGRIVEDAAEPPSPLLTDGYSANALKFSDADKPDIPTLRKLKKCTSGVKHDNGKIKAAVLAEFSDALTAVAEVGTFGVEKYSRGAWLSVPDAKERYTDAMWRHLLAEASEANDRESGLLHAAHMAWNALARLQIELNEQTGE